MSDELDKPDGKRFWTCALMTLLNSGVSAGFSLAFMLGQGRGDIFARYAAARSIALLLVVLIAIGVRSRDAITVLGIAMTAVQLFDAVIGALNHDLQETLGPSVLAVFNAFAVGWLLRGRESRSSSRLTKQAPGAP